MVRFKNRYYLVELCYPPDIQNAAKSAFVFPSPKELVHRLRTIIAYYSGQFGLGLVLSNISAKYYNTETNLFIIKAARTADNFMRECIMHINDSSILFQGDTVVSEGVANILRIIPKILHVGGSLKLTCKAAVSIDKRSLIQVKKVANGSEDKKELIEQCKLENLKPKKKKKNKETKFTYVQLKPQTEEAIKDDDEKKQKELETNNAQKKIKKIKPKKVVSKTTKISKSELKKKIGISKKFHISNL